MCDVTHPYVGHGETTPYDIQECLTWSFAMAYSERKMCAHTYFVQLALWNSESFLYVHISTNNVFRMNGVHTSVNVYVYVCAHISEWWIYTDTFTYVHTYVTVYVYVCAHVSEWCICTDTFTYVYTYVTVYVYVCAHVSEWCVCTDTFTYVHTYVTVYVYVCAHISEGWIYTDTLTYVHTYVQEPAPETRRGKGRQIQPSEPGQL